MPAQGPATTESLRARHDAIVTLFNEHAQTTVASVQQQALDELLPSLQEELDLDEEGMAKAQAFLEEKSKCRKRGRALPTRVERDASLHPKCCGRATRTSSTAC